MPVDSGQKFIRRNRAPRVHITYEDPYDAEKQIELPFVMGVLADLSGNSPGVEKAKLEERKFLEFDMDNFESRMAAIEPGVTMRVKNELGDEGGEKLSVNLKFKKMEDFSPAQVARQVAADGKAARSSRTIGQPAALHGRQGGCGGPAQKASQRSADDAGVTRSRRG